jgi:dienelactone hydrolase
MNRRTVLPMDPEGGREHLPATARASFAGFASDGAPPDLSNHDLPRRGPYGVKRLSFRSVGDNGQPDDLVTATYYVGRRTTPRPLVLIVPIWGRPDVYPVRKLARAVRRRSDGAVHVLVLEAPRRLMDFHAMVEAKDEDAFRREAAVLAGRCRNAIVDVRRLLDWLEARPEVDPDRIAIVGFSAGGVYAADLFLLDERIDTAVIAMGGTGFASIMAHDPRRASIAREYAAERFGWSVERYRDEMDAIFGHLDADRLAGRYEPERVLMIEAGRDERIPPRSRERLWDALGRPERVLLDYRHRNAFFSMTPVGGNYTTDRIWEFLDASLSRVREDGETFP